MRGSAKRKEPEPLRSWKTGEQDASIRPRYDNLPGDLRNVIRRALFIEQTGQCVYCGRWIDLNEHGKHHVEHFRPRTSYPDLELAFGNLFLSCGPRHQQAGPQPTCGNRKDD